MTASNPQTYIAVERRPHDRVAIVKLSRPEKLNAFNDAMVLQLSEALHELDVDDEIWAIVIAGEGRAFSSGADVHQRQLRSHEEFERQGGVAPRGAWGEELLQGMRHWKPVIVAVHGYVMGMALGLALDAEIIVADEATQFQITEVGRGYSVARFAGLLRQRGCGAFAEDVALTGRFFTAEEALRHGVINALTRNDTHLVHALEIAAAINANPPLGVRSTVRMRRFRVEQVNRLCALYVEPLQLHLTDDFQESARAFAEGRSPSGFRGL